MDDCAIGEGYIYLLGRALVVRQEHIDRGAADFAFNRIKYNPLGTADFVNPNFDVAYLEAWIGVDPQTPAILEVPRIEGRYYTAQILDEWGEVITNINERIFPSKPCGKFALVYPNSSAPIPADAGRIELHSAKAKLLGRVELKGDPDGAVALQKAFRLNSLGTPTIADAAPMPLFGNDELIGVDIFNDVEAVLASALDVSPIAASMQQQVRAIAARVASDADERARVDKLIRETIVPRFKQYVFTQSGPYRNHWVGGAAAGNYGSDFHMRGAINYAGIWANNIGEVTYYVAMKDADGQPLDGDNAYAIHFPPDQLPDTVVDAYWSVILVDPTDFRVVPNDLKRYNFNNHSPLAKEADGSLKIGIGAAPVAGISESNWLPAAAGKPFSLTFRTYVPREVVRTGGWSPPVVTRVN